MSGDLSEIGRLRDHLLGSYRAAPLESISVAIASLAHLAKSYQRSRPMLLDSIDCSTLVSQAHWDGAAVQTPFIAENQRTAKSAAAVSSLLDVLPGDVLVAYASLDRAPGGRHNHVAMVLTNDAGGDGWVIQSAEGSGTTIVPLAEARVGGGIRRFCPNPLVPYADGDWTELARRVPKLGRLGVRLRNPAGEEHRHTGVDLHVDYGTPLYAPIDGTVTVDRGRASIVVRNQHLETASALLPIQVAPKLTDGDTVSRGDLLGTSSWVPPGLACDSTVFAGDLPHVHWELWTTVPMGYHSSSSVKAPAGFSEPGYRAYSPVYAVKLGRIGSPLTAG